MSNLIATENKTLAGMASLEEEARNEERRINRIVLYIDDLDRCPPDKVVQVLQAVHLLGTFSLFVIVVAVDARWVSRALTSHYRDMLGDGVNQHDDGLAIGQATPHDYLEKVFQIPFWIRPMTVDGAGSMLDKLLDEATIGDGERGGGAAARRADDGQAGAGAGSAAGADTGTVGQTSSAAGGGGQHRPGVGADAAKTAVSPPIDLDPDRLRIVGDELKFMQELRPLLGRSPRALKRFVNCYRLIKAGVPTDAQEAFVRGTGADSPFRVVLFLLAVVTGARSLSRPLFTALATRKDGDEPSRPLTTLASVVDSVRRRVDAAEILSLDDWLESHEGGAWKQASTGAFAEWAPDVARYSFRVEPLG